MEAGYYTRGNKKTVRAPDVSFISYERLPANSVVEGYLSFPPDFLVEVVSPNDRADKIEAKIKEWLDFGVSLIWVVYPDTRSVYVYTGHDKAIVRNVGETLDGGSVFPGFTLAVSAIFED